MHFACTVLLVGLNVFLEPFSVLICWAINFHTQRKVEDLVACFSEVKIFISSLCYYFQSYSQTMFSKSTIFITAATSAAVLLSHSAATAVKLPTICITW